MLLLAGPAFGQAQDIEREKIARTTMKFLNVSAHPRAASLGDAMTALEIGAMSMLYNPAGMSGQNSFLNVSVSQADWFVDVEYNFATLSVRPYGGRWGVFGFSLVAVDYGEIEETIRFDNDDGYLDLGTFSPTALSFGVGYARTLTDRFSIGAHVKYARQDLGNSVISTNDELEMDRADNEESVIAYDFGMLYRTGFRSLTFAAAARNFAPEVEYEEESYELPLLLTIGVSMNLTDFTNVNRDMHSFVVSVDTESPRDYHEQIKIGGEYTFLNTISLRAGYIFPTDQQGINAGIGIHRTIGGISIGGDYAYTDFGVFDSVHRIGLELSL